MRQTLYISLLVLLLAANGCAPERSPLDPFRGPTVFLDQPVSARKKEPRPLPDNLWDPARPVWVPYYELPAGWEISPSDRGSIRGTWLDRPDTVFISISLYSTKGMSPLEARDAQAVAETCSAEERTLGLGWRDCDRPIETDEIEIDGRLVYVLRYWGDWMGKHRRTEEFYFEHDGKTRVVALQGGLDADRAVVSKIISTLEFRYEIFVAQPEDEELGGL